ncbi:MAG TPA: MAPEG family protein, partial [Myxococcota bacterium]|nr:MAPEG family protein [Myxococcota bacterium]
FYAVALAAQLGGAADGVNVGLAWCYVAVRVVHSFVQATKNVIPVRFTLFALGSVVLFALLVRTAFLL